jgi:hypothetical protein
MYYSTKPSVMHYLVALAFTVGSRQGVLAANDWLAPCLQGNCSWDLPSDSGTSGTLQIVRYHSHLPTRPQRAFGSSLITITTVGPHHRNLGYHLRGRVADHALRPIGDGAGYSARVSGCKHGLRSPLPGRCRGYHRPAARRGRFTELTIFTIRPYHSFVVFQCGPMPFARVANHWTNQSNTPSSRAITTRASDAEVHSLTLDTNFSAVSPSP